MKKKKRKCKRSRRKELGKLNLNRHHWTNKCKGGKSTKDNVSWLNIAKHRAWHFIFKNLSLREVIELLQKMERIKLSQRGSQ